MCIRDRYRPAVSVLSTVDSGVNLNNVTDLYSNVLRLVDILENSTSLTKSDLGEAAYANSLYVEKSSNLLNEINKSLNSGITQHGDLAPVTTLHFSNLLLLETEVLKNMGSLKRVNQLLYERAYDLKSKGKLTEADVAKYKQMCIRDRFILPINRTLLTAGGTHYMPNRLEVDLASEEYPSTCLLYTS